MKRQQKGKRRKNNEKRFLTWKFPYQKNNRNTSLFAHAVEG